MIVFWDLRGIFSIGVVDPSGFGWGLFPRSRFRVYLPCFSGVDFGV